MRNITAFILLAGLCAAAAQAADTAPQGHHLVWADEFEADGRPDPNNWTFERGFLRNHELQWYQPENAFCEGGKLIIEGRRQRKPNPNYRNGSTDWKQSRETIEYTSSSLTTRRLHSWKYGIFEVKAKIVAQDGLWPAIWFLGVEGQWPSCGEIDLMEYYRGMILANAADLFGPLALYRRDGLLV